MPIIDRTGSIFTSDAQVLVNTVNCLGVMGAGIALEMRYRYPAMFRLYAQRCERNEVRIGTLDLHRETDPWILNFPTKKHWRHPSRPEYLTAGLTAFRESWNDFGIESIAFPLLGASHGGLAPAASRRIMTGFLDDLPIAVEIWTFDPIAPDDLIEPLRRRLATSTDQQIAKESRIPARAVTALRTAAETAHQVSQFGDLPGFGEGTMEKLFAFAIRSRDAGAPADQGVLQFEA